MRAEVRCSGDVRADEVCREAWLRMGDWKALLKRLEGNWRPGVLGV